MQIQFLLTMNIKVLSRRQRKVETTEIAVIGCFKPQSIFNAAPNAAMDTLKMKPVIPNTSGLLFKGLKSEPV